MQLTKLTNLLVLGAALTMTGVGCKTHPYKPTPLLGRKQTPNDPSLGRGNQLGGGAGLDNSGGIKSTDGGIPPNPSGMHDRWAENTEALKGQTIYFEYDKSAIRSAEQGKLEEVANYLKSNAGAAVKVEGSCDERGTEEYNRSLGERRALAAREYLVRLGIDPGRVDTISFGEDKPAEMGHNEAAWSKNRRDDFVVLTPPVQ